jgi:predicted small lipoprotein YifL
MRKSLRAGLAAAIAVVALAGCGGGSSSSPPSDSTSSAKPEEQRTSDAAVATGMKAIDKLATQIAEAPAAQGKTLSEGIEPLWMPVEGTVQANSQETYDALEAAFTKLESGDVTQAQEGARAASEAIDAYLAKFPG